MPTTDTKPALSSDSRIGIVNRGEPAIRFIRAVREYNEMHGTRLRTVALYLDEESDALFVTEADDSVAFRTVPGATQIGAIYLDRQVILRALETAGCDAVWPGWGFVSEDAEFAATIERAGMVFLGPDARAMGLLGDKIAAKELAERSDVPILPWSKREIRDLEDARAISREIGYPVIVKAAHAGGGRGIRFVMTEAELEPQFNAAREETMRITGDQIVFIERLVVTGRHLEVQCLSDRHGNVYTFGVRDCSVQRRNQKIIEETPPPHMSLADVAEIEGSASRLMAAANYESAGTVEFLYDVDRGQYYFMEVNTRLQVEHPITEILYQIDLVQGQIDVAFGHALEIEKREPRGVVLEARLNAEDPDREFTPAPGYVRYFRTPSGPGVRVDSGIEAGSTIPSLFDSMVAKVIAFGADRRQAIGRLRRALYETRIKIDGGTTNKAFLLQLLNQPEIIDGGVHTKYVEALLARASTRTRGPVDVALVAAAVSAYLEQQREEIDLFRRQVSNIGYPRTRPSSGGFEVTFGYEGNSYSFTVRQTGAHLFYLRLEETELSVEFADSPAESRLSYNGSRYAIQTIRRGDSLQVEIDGIPVVLALESGGAVSAPSPAVVLSLSVKPGDTVEKGERLLSLEAMKMEMIIEAPAAGVVTDVLVSAGQQVAAGEPLLQLEESGGAENEPQVEAGALVEIAADPQKPEAEWQRLTRSLLALFAGYDHTGAAGLEFDAIAAFVERYPEYRERFFELIYRALELTVSIDTAFSSERIAAEQFARTVSWQELVYITFRYEMMDSDTLPAVFLDALGQALALYPNSVEQDGRWRGFYHMQRAYQASDDRLELIRGMMFTLEGMPLPSGRSQGLLRMIDNLIRLHQIGRPGLADAALHARYHLYEQNKVTTLRRQRSERVQKSISRMLSLAPQDPERTAIEQRIVDSSPYIVYELIEAHRRIGPSDRPAIVALLARHLVRDRDPRAVTVEQFGEVTYATVTAAGVTSLVLISATVTGIPAHSVVELADRISVDEIVIVYGAPENEEPQAVFDAFAARQINAARVSVGVYQKRRHYSYRTFHTRDGSWAEDELRREFSPLFYRELRLARLSEFDYTVLYHSDSVFLVSAKAHVNPKDERLFAFCTASESEPQIGESGRIERLNEFDEVFMEAVFKMRSEQARRQRRLFWNRIVVHVRNLISLTARQIQDYGEQVVPRTRDLGLEKIVVFSRRKRWSEDVLRNLELLFLNISEDQFTLRSRTPSDEPYKPMDLYVSSVVRSRQRKNVYPYEVIKMITYTGYPVSLNVPRGEFEEFDVEVDENGAQHTVSVKQREYGQNTSNVVFGMVRNQDHSTGQAFKRVLILSDATRDMGSLAEGECRRIIAALDLAENEQVPVEWIPISSGARIDMESGTENLDWTAAVVRRIVEFTQVGGEINVIVSGINVGAQSYWNAEATMLMHTRGLLIMTDDASMLLTGKKALDFSGSVSAESNVEIGGVERIMGPNGQAQIWVPNLSAAYKLLFDHYRFTYVAPGEQAPRPVETEDPADRDMGSVSYDDRLGQGFSKISDIFSVEYNPERKKPFDMRQVMAAAIDSDSGYLERWAIMKDAETAIVWETRIGGYGVGMIGIESRALARLGDVPHDGPESWSGGTLFPQSSRKVARAINSWSGRVPAVVFANLSGFDGSPESLRRLQLEYGAEIGRAVVNFKGPLVFIVVARYHGGAYVVFSKALNPSLKAFAIKGSYASVLGGAPAAAVVFPRQVEQATREDPRVVEAGEELQQKTLTQREYDELYRKVHTEKQSELGQRFDSIHSVERARSVGSIDEILSIRDLRRRVIEAVSVGG
jgi:acetyl/propionyl-CoA carboxylase alpha subunit/acetyl-CoA carboxylase carboxyltransferase component